jgi:hypothetical protein
MTGGTRRMRRLMERLSWAGAATAAIGLAALLSAAPQGTALASSPSGFNQITGAGATPSAVTIPWTQGLRDASNQPLAAATGELSPNSDRGSASPASPLKFMYPDFQHLQVTVSQTQNIRHQGITVSWSGFTQTFVNTGSAQTDYLQIMECYGDATTGPSPQQCEFGSPGLMGSGSIDNQSAGSRQGDTCQVTTPPDPSNPSLSLSGSNAFHGCDPYEPGTGTPSHYAPPCTAADSDPNCDKTTYSIPFVPAGQDPTDPNNQLYGTDINKSFNQFQTNEVQEATTGVNGTGQQQFETLTGIQSQGLGCGDQDNGQVRNCWLVIVPRGTWDPNGFHALPQFTATDVLLSSPLSAGNWAQRIQVHLNYAPDGAFCDLNTPQVHTAGTQLISRAMASWIVSLAQQNSCKSLYSFVVNSEPQLTVNLTGSGTGVGLGFTTIPIGTEGLEDPGGHAVKVPKTLYAPVAVTALGFGFNINLSTGYITNSMKLTPGLLAKALTQVYRSDLPDFYPAGGSPGPSWSLTNPLNVSSDPEFQKLNNVPAAFPGFASTETTAPLLIGDKNALIQQVWKWIQSGATASAWLDGTPDNVNHITADPDYVSLKLGKTASAIFPRVYQGVLNNKTAPSLPANARKDTGLLLPPVDTFDLSASNVLTANNPTLGTWDNSLQNPQDGSNGWWDSVPPMPVTQRFAWGIADTPSLAAYGLVPASLCTGDGSDGTGTGCAALSVASVTTALQNAKPDSAGLLHVDPAKPGSGGYPLVNVIYAAVPTQQSAAQLNSYADLISFAAGSGQTAGSAPGNLPPGYLPLPASLQQRAQSVVAQLRQLARPTPTHSPTTTPPTSTSTSPAQSSGGTSAPAAGGGGNSTAGITTGATSKPGTSTPYVTPGPSVPQSLVIEPPAAQLASGTTPKQNVGSVRWAIIAVVIAGLVSAGAGILLRSPRLPWPFRRLRGAGP